MIIYLFPALVLLTIVMAAIGINRIRKAGNRVSDRLRNIHGRLEFDSKSMEESFAGKAIPWWIRPIAWIGFVVPGSSSEVLRWELASAGHRHRDAPRVFAGLRLLTSLVLGLGVMWVASRFTDFARNEVILITAISVALGYMVPWMVVRWIQRNRRQEMTLALPDALDLLVICVEAGQGMNAALMSVTRESELHSPALSDELRLVNLEMSTGSSRQRALRNLALRTGIDDVRGLVAVLIQSDKFGTSVAQALRTHAQSLRTRRRQRAEEAARKTPVKMVFPLVFCIFPALMTVLLAPAMIDLFKALGVSQ